MVSRIPAKKLLCLMLACSPVAFAAPPRPLRKAEVRPALVARAVVDRPIWREAVFGPEPRIRAIRDRNAPIVSFAQSSDVRFLGGPKTVFGKWQPGLKYEYSDRLAQYDSAKYKRATEAADQGAAKANTAAWMDAFMSAYLGRPVKVHHITTQLVGGQSINMIGYTNARPRRSR